MFKKTKVREILELLNKGLSAREIAKVLAVSRNSVASVKEVYDQCDKDWDEIKAMSDDELYSFFYPHKFYPRNRFVPVDYAYVHKELKKVGVTEMLLWQEYCARCDEEGADHCCYTTFANGYGEKAAAKRCSSWRKGLSCALFRSSLMKYAAGHMGIRQVLTVIYGSEKDSILCHAHI